MISSPRIPDSSAVDDLSYIPGIKDAGFIESSTLDRVIAYFRGALKEHPFNNFAANLPGGRRAINVSCEDYSLLGEKDLSKDITMGGFFQDCEQAVFTAGLSLEEVVSADCNLWRYGKELEFFILVFPVYVALRKKGYSHYDLVR